MGLFRGAWELLAEVLFPANIYCISCGSMITRDRAYSLCDKCMEDIHWITGRSCSKCGKALNDDYNGSTCYSCMIREHRFVRGISCMTYGLLERQMILDLKYNGKGYLGTVFGEIMADRLAVEGLETDLIIPVPVHKLRKKKRGYNQTQIMAAQLSRISGIPMREHALIRSRNTALLRSMNPMERESAMKGAFLVPDSEVKYIQGKRVLLIDDIITTGATLDACTDALLGRGAECVYVMTLAAGGNRKPSELQD